jgi:hypothetical protein
MGRKVVKLKCYLPQLSGFIGLLFAFLPICRWEAIEFGLKSRTKYFWLLKPTFYEIWEMVSCEFSSNCAARVIYLQPEGYAIDNQE